MASKGRIEYNERKRNVPKAVLDSWQRLREPRDMKALQKLTKRSAPVIRAALNNGYVKSPALANQITQYYTTRPKEVTVKGADALIKKAAKV